MVERRLRKPRQVGASREVLPQEQIAVFVGAALPGTLWIAEVDLHIRGYRKLLVLGHLQPAIPGEMSSRSASVSAKRERRRVAGGMPPRGNNTARMRLCGLSKARPVRNGSVAVSIRGLSHEPPSFHPCARKISVKRNLIFNRISVVVQEPNPQMPAEP